MSKIIARPIGMLMLFSAAFAGSQPAYSIYESTYKKCLREE